MVRPWSYLWSNLGGEKVHFGYAAIAQLVERRHGKAKVTSSNLVGGSI